MIGRSIGRASLIVLCVIVTFFLLAVVQRGTVWSRESGVGIYLLMGLSWFIATCCAGYAASQTAGLSAGDAIARGRSLRSPLRIFASVSVATGLGAAVAIAIVAIVVVTVTWVTTGDVRTPPNIILIARPVASAFSGAFLGAFIGNVWPHPLAPIVAGSAVFALGLLRAGGLSELVAPISSSVTLIDLRPSLTPIAAITVATIAVAACLASITLMVLSRSSSGPVKQASLVTMAAVAAIAIPGLTHATAQLPVFTVLDPVPQASCADVDDATRVCVAVDSGFDAGATAQTMAPMVRALKLAGVEPLTTYTQGGGSTTRVMNDSTGLVVTSGSPSQDPSMPATDLAQALAAPRPCAQFRADLPPERALLARIIISDWLAARTGGQTSYSGPQEMAWLRSPSATNWVRAAYPLLRDCKLSDISIPKPYARNIAPSSG